MVRLLKKAFGRKDKRNSHAGVFVDGVSDEPNLKSDYSEYLVTYQKKISAILKGKQLAWLDSFFMCPPGFPEVSMVVLNGEECFNLSKKEGRYKAVRIDFLVEHGKHYHGRISLGMEELELNCNDGSVTAKLVNLGKTVKIKTKKGYFSLSILRTPVAKLIWLSGAKNILLFDDWGSDWPFNSISFHSLSGSLGVVGFQDWSEQHARYDFPPFNQNERRLTVKSAPYWVREWEERSRKLWHISIALRVCADYLLKHDQKCDQDFIFHLNEMSGLIHYAVGNFTHWRPSSSQEARVSEWERGNWASGFLCGAFGLSSGLLKDMQGVKNSRNDVRDIAIKKGADWLVRDTDKPYTSIDFPPVAHWLRRSTNHGIVILASALVGLEEVDRVSPGTDVKSSIAQLKEEFWTLLNDSFKQGVYLEGIRYAQFSLQEAIAYIIYDYRRSKEEWKEFYLKRFPNLPLVKEFIVSAIYPGSEIPMASWGDCPILPWKRSVLNFLDSIDSHKNIEINEQIYFEEGGVQLLNENEDEILKTEPLTLPTLLLPRVKHVGILGCEEINLFSDSVASIKKNMGQGVFPNWHLYVVTTPVHLTHNKDHDLASFFWIVNGKICLGEVPGRGVYCHNTIGAVESMLKDDSDKYSCYGGEDSGILVDRHYSGSICQRETNANIIIFEAKSKDGVLFKNSNPLVTNYRREFIIIGSNEPILIIITRGHSGERNIFVNYVCPNGVAACPEEESEFWLAEEKATLRLLNYSNKIVRYEKTNYCSSQRIIEDCSGSEEVLSIALCESTVKKSSVTVDRDQDGNCVISCVTPFDERYLINISGADSESIVTQQH